MKQSTGIVLFFCCVFAIAAGNLYLHNHSSRPVSAPPPSSSVYQLPSSVSKKNLSQSSSPFSWGQSSSSSSSPPVEEDSYTLFPCGPIQVAIPDKYIPYLQVETAPLGISVWEKISLEQSQKDEEYTSGFLFSIDAITADELPLYIVADPSKCWILGQDSQYYYAYSAATDWQLYRSNGVTDADQALWDQLQQFSNEVAEDTRLRNGLSAYTPPPSSPSSSPVLPYQAPERIECPTCHGGLLCIQCGGVGSCTRCGGSGKTICTSCSGVSHCMSCGGRGYIYAGVGQLHRQERCSRCGGTGDCRTCQNTGRMTCTSCYGSPSCLFCQGLGLCPACNGTGYLW